MALYLQPCDWIEHDVDFKYVVDVYGRTNEGNIARLRLTGFQPYLYLRAKQGDTAASIQTTIANESGKQLRGIVITSQLKLDAMRGFRGLEPTKVWKISCPALWMFKTVAKTLKQIRGIATEDIYESNLPPLLRLFHERDIQPASPLEFVADEEADEDVGCDICYTTDYESIKPFNNISIPLYVAAYDIEVYSDSGQFPVSSNPKDEIIQIGVSFRWSDTLLQSEVRYVFVSGKCADSHDPTVTFVSCSNEADLLRKFHKCIQEENPDILAGYNTFGFDDSYIGDRAERLRLDLNFGRVPSNQWGKISCIKTEKKVFELASGKFAVRYIDMPGRLNIDLYLSMRREQNLDSYKLDNVSTVFLRDKVVNTVEVTAEKTEIHTKSTRGLFAGNLVRFDIVTNTINPYRNGQKFYVKEVFPKKFIVELPPNNYLFDDLTADDKKKLEWSFAKDDVHAKEMFASHHGTPEDRAHVAKYCIQDCDLVLTLMAKLDTLVNARGMADVCRVPIQYIFLRGQGIKIYSAVVYNASKRNQIIMTQEGVEGDASYEGAIVLPPKIGMYLDQPIPVLDFNSLYPSNMIAYNLSPDTLAYVKNYDMNGKLSNPDSVKKFEGFQIDEVGYDLKNDDGEIVGRQICGFVQPTVNQQTVGLLPLTLDILLKKRKETRKKMETVEDEAQKSVLNGLQLAYKVVANSVYGQCGSKTSPIRRMEVAASTTAVGRMKIHEAKSIVVSQFGAEVVYGDSVASYTPLMLRINGEHAIMSPDELGRMGEWRQCNDRDKEYCELNGVESWTDDGWTPVERIIRHKLAEHKKMIRVLTHTGLVDVTDDHSLLRPDGTSVSSKDLTVGNELLHAPYPISTNIVQSGTLIDEARIAGFFVGDGSCGIYECPSGEKSSWELNNSNIELLEKYKLLCERVFPYLDWTINPTLVSSGVYKLVPISKHYGALKRFIQSYRSAYYVDKRKNIPSWILNGSIEIRRAFFDGFYDADGDKDMNGYIRIDQKNHVTSAQLAFIGSTLGYSVSLNTRTDKPGITRITFTKSLQRKNPNSIKKLYEIKYEGYVYDLTTANHHFQAGVGKMIVHNTDSIFVKFPTKDLQTSMDMARKAADMITASGRKAHRIEYEKTFYPFILFCRKRYVGMMYEDDTVKCKRKSMGIAIKRRDNAPIVKDVFGGALDILMEERDIRKAQKFVQDMLVKVIKNEMPLDKYIVTKQLRDDYKNPDQIAHAVLAERMKERDEGSAPQVGDRLAYIYVAERKDKKKQGDKIEEISYVREKGLKPDTEFYITNQIQNPLAQMFALALEDLEGYVPKVDYKRLLQETIEAGTDEEDATLMILKRKEKELENLMFMGARYLAKHKTGPIDKWFSKT
jgi:DNA polymerase elongation subunit (family B)